MTSKREHTQHTQLRELQSAGYDISDKRAVRLHTNPVDETDRHSHAKMACAKVLAEAGYFIDSEVTHDSGVIADLIAYGLDERNPIVVELESEYDEQVKQDNLSLYQYGPIREVYTFDVQAFPKNIDPMKDKAKELLGL